VLLLAAGLLGVLVVLLLLVVLVEGVAAGAHGCRRRDLLRDLVPVRVLGVLLRLVLLVLHGREEKNSWKTSERSEQMKNK
jgi:Mg2+/citrate symporter